MPPEHQPAGHGHVRAGRLEARLPDALHAQRRRSRTIAAWSGVSLPIPRRSSKIVRGGLVGDTAFRIPPGEPNYEVKAKHMFLKDTLLLNLMPHMHLRGKDFQYEAEYPDGTREVLLDVPHYDFNWQIRYSWTEPKLMPKGTRLHCTAHFDNSADNLANPDPDEGRHLGRPDLGRDDDRVLFVDGSQAGSDSRRTGRKPSPRTARSMASPAKARSPRPRPARKPISNQEGRGNSQEQGRPQGRPCSLRLASIAYSFRLPPRRSLGGHWPERHNVAGSLKCFEPFIL